MVIGPCLNQILALCLQSIARKLDLQKKKCKLFTFGELHCTRAWKNWSNLGCRPSLTVDPCPIFVPAPEFGLGTSFYFAARLQIEFPAIMVGVGKIDFAQNWRFTSCFTQIIKRWCMATPVFKPLDIWQLMFHQKKFLCFKKNKTNS